ncbi:hypothetical protein BaRGS_00024422 [Batillaria attramentaria]|uniref:Uncharacterized protein n=1 Tax=Batillaria attramentaria TaxID=370345 RepID=A0ABD0KB54_9CAEN
MSFEWHSTSRTTAPYINRAVRRSHLVFAVCVHTRQDTAAGLSINRKPCLGHPGGKLACFADGTQLCLGRPYCYGDYPVPWGKSLIAESSNRRRRLPGTMAGKVIVGPSVSSVVCHFGAIVSRWSLVMLA